MTLISHDYLYIPESSRRWLDHSEDRMIVCSWLFNTASPRRWGLYVVGGGLEGISLLIRVSYTSGEDRVCTYGSGIWI